MLVWWLTQWQASAEVSLLKAATVRKYVSWQNMQKIVGRHRNDVSNGWAEVELVEGTGVWAYASVIDNTTGDPSTIVMNRTYSPLKKYVQARAVSLTEEGKEQARERYAVGAGVAFCASSRLAAQ